MILRLLILTLFPIVTFGQTSLVKTKVTKDITVSIPRGWIPMSQMDFVERYPSVRAPLVAYTNDERSADFSINTSATQWPDTDAELAQKFFRASLMNMFDKVDFIDQGVRESGGKKFIFFEFESRVNGNRTEAELKDPVLRYNYITYLVQKDRTLVFSFNCPRRLREEWYKTAAAIMKSVKVK
jgi:hypothetical protein